MSQLTWDRMRSLAFNTVYDGGKIINDLLSSSCHWDSLFVMLFVAVIFPLNRTIITCCSFFLIFHPIHRFWLGGCLALKSLKILGLPMMPILLYMRIFLHDNLVELTTIQ